jgi:hypothetical protein
MDMPMTDPGSSIDGLGIPWIDRTLCQQIESSITMEQIDTESLQALGVTTLAIFSHLQVAIRRTAHLDSGPGQQLARAINEHARALHCHRIEVGIHWDTGHSGMPGNEQADRQASKARDG